MTLSVVISLYNEENNIKPLLGKLTEALSEINYELILVNDGSKDGTLSELQKHATTRTKIIDFTKNFGQSPAMKAGIDASQGEFIVTMDGDLQNDPADIPKMLQIAQEEDWDVVAGVRKNRKDHGSRTFASKIANALIRNLTDVRLSDYGCSLRVYRSRIAKGLDLFGELHRFIPVLSSIQGARMTEIDVAHHPRIHGESKYGFKRTFKVVVDLIFMIFFQKYLQRPMHIFGILGIASSGIGFLICFVMLVQKIFYGVLMGPRPLLTLGILLIIIGIQFITLGVVAEMLMRIYFASTKKEPYIIKEVTIGTKEVG